MPIRPENRTRYPKDWRETSLYIRRDRAEWRCECTGQCGLHEGRRCTEINGHAAAIEFRGGKPAPDLAYLKIDFRGRRVVTWAEVHKARRECQRKILEGKRNLDQGRSAYKVWVAYYDMDLMGGWQAFIETYCGGWHDRRVWIDRDRPGLKRVLLDAFPLLLPLGSEHDQWAAWKPAFAAAYQRRQDRRPLGVAYVWWDGYGEMTVVSTTGSHK